MRRAVLAVVVCLCLALPTAAALLAKSAGSHRGGSAKGSGSSQPVHVKSYTKKDGTRVEEHERKAAEPKTESRSTTETTTHAPAPIRIYTDPVTGRKTITNEPAPLLPARALPMASTPRIVPPTPMTIAPSLTSSPTARRTATAPRSVTSARAASGVTRAANSRIARSEAVKRAFEAQSGYPHGRPGYVVDHIKPLACGGADAPSNMQWQTIAAAKAKDKTERASCR